MILQLSILMLVLFGCGRNNKKPVTTPTTVPAMEVTPTPFTETKIDGKEYYAGSFAYVYPSDNSRAWYCNGTLQLQNNVRGQNSGNVWTAAGSLEEYTVTNAENKELFAVKAESDGNGGKAYVLHVGNLQKTLATVSDGEACFEILSWNNRMLFIQNGTSLFAICTEPDRFCICISGDTQAETMVFPVNRFVAEQPETPAFLTADAERLLPSKKSVTDLYDGIFLDNVIKEARSAVYAEWPEDYAQCTELERKDANGRKSYRAIYQSNTVLVDRTDNAPLTEYAFNGLSEGTGNVEYYRYSYDGLSDTLCYTFPVEELDRFRTEIFTHDQEILTRKDAVRKELIPFIITRTEDGFMERGICDSGDMKRDYVRFVYQTDTLVGDIVAVYEDETRNTQFVMVDGLGRDSMHVYADGFIRRTEEGSIRELVTRTYDTYGLAVKEEEGNVSVTMKYNFSEFAYGGEDDTVRHEWRKLIPYLENAPKPQTGETDLSAPGNDTDGNDTDGLVTDGNNTDGNNTDGYNTDEDDTNEDG